MTRTSMISRVLAPLAIAISLGGFAATAEAATKTTCAGAICFNKETGHRSDGLTAFRLTFSGSAVTHYNIRFQEPGGRLLQREMRTRPGTNLSEPFGLRGTPGQKYDIYIQACSQTKVGVGPFSVSTKSSCTGWVRIGFYAV